MNKSKKEEKLENKILNKLKGKPKKLAQLIFNDKEIQALQNHSNTVSINRLGFNDHGPVHMKKSALNSLVMFDLLKKENINFNLEKEDIGEKKDSKIAVIFASLIHDIGMSIGRDNHDLLSVTLADPIVKRLLNKIYPKNIFKRTIVKSTILEGIIGHMGNHQTNSMEAGLVLIGDGCDMERGRARIPSLISTEPRAGDIHRFSASTITNLIIKKGQKKPIEIDVNMKETAGLFQIEKVLIPKITSSAVQDYIELYAI